MKLIKPCIAMAAVAALFVVPSVASATSPTLCETTALGCDSITVGADTTIIATNVAHTGEVTTTKMVTGLGNVECETATLTGKLTKNAGGVIEGDIETAEFWGKPGQKPPHPAGQRCSGGFGGDTLVTPNHTNNPCHTPTGGTSHCSLPWCLKAEGNKNVFSVRGGNCSEAARPLTFTLDTTTLGACSYERKAAVTGTYTTHPADLVATVTGGEEAKFTKITGSAFCPNTGELFMAFTLTTDVGGEEGDTLYIK